jgi:hypothetical protein
VIEERQHLRKEQNIQSHLRYGYFVIKTFIVYDSDYFIILNISGYAFDTYIYHIVFNLDKEYHKVQLMSTNQSANMT